MTHEHRKTLGTSISQPSYTATTRASKRKETNYRQITERGRRRVRERTALVLLAFDSSSIMTFHVIHWEGGGGRGGANGKIWGMDDVENVSKKVRELNHGVCVCPEQWILALILWEGRTMWGCKREDCQMSIVSVRIERQWYREEKIRGLLAWSVRWRIVGVRWRGREEHEKLKERN